MTATHDISSDSPFIQTFTVFDENTAYAVDIATTSSYDYLTRLSLFFCKLYTADCGLRLVVYCGYWLNASQKCLKQNTSQNILLTLFRMVRPFVCSSMPSFLLLLK